MSDDKQTYDYGCVMLYFNFPEIKNIHSLINSEDIYTEEGDNSFGLEDEPHTTLLYGLHDGVTEEDVRNVVDNFDYGTCRLTNPSLFNSEKYDVLKYDVSGPNLHETNAELTELPHTTSFPNYHPHLTIGYIKKGEGQKYADKLKELNFKLDPTHIVYSLPSGEHIEIPINV